jgi:hypothetical protein
LQNSQIIRTHDKKQASSLRKRQQPKESPNHDSTETTKRRKEDDSIKTKRSEDRDPRNKTIDNKRSQSSRRHKQDEEK